MFITEQWVKLHLDQPDNKKLVSQTAGMRQFRGYSAREVAHWTFTVFTCAQLPMHKFEQKSQQRARCN